MSQGQEMYRERDREGALVLPRQRGATLGGEALRGVHLDGRGQLHLRGELVHNGRSHDALRSNPMQQVLRG